MNLSILPGRYAIARLAPEAGPPSWARGALVSVTRTAKELSVVCEESGVPDEVPSERGWRCLKVAGPIDFAVTGVVFSIAQPLFRAGISLFVMSTFETDYVLVKEERLERAVEALEAAGHRVET
jgi:hypothetical protein